MAKKTIKYFSMHWYGTYQVCTSHTSHEAAVKAAVECESRGGSKHDIWKCEKMPRPRYKRGRRDVR